MRKVLVWLLITSELSECDKSRSVKWHTCSHYMCLNEYFDTSFWRKLLKVAFASFFLYALYNKGPLVAEKVVLGVSKIFF